MLCYGTVRCNSNMRQRTSLARFLQSHCCRHPGLAASVRGFDRFHRCSLATTVRLDIPKACHALSGRRVAHVTTQFSSAGVIAGRPRQVVESREGGSVGVQVGGVREGVMRRQQREGRRRERRHVGEELFELVIRDRLETGAVGVERLRRRGDRRVRQRRHRLRCGNVRVRGCGLARDGGVTGEVRGRGVG